ncbi:hypothetical protein JNUCC42_19610 [Brevibacterium sp. JNUCC-42]|uniref:Uncharacterized protein n=1 Tax=Brevibacillus laterosporus TaxID=1465 RepID=A0A502IFI9_BRELA|nr:hypothetical protein [Brevibacillus laterosporus]QOS98668.1 hypothetical protein JNUCC42_19610 [Brevibacterium sp. JNUCC-42]QDX92189.1 hypothetical protein EEL30_07280 [Brevibacillus laterosporus]RAP26038.1 hypothetical protein C2W64_02247 [Brevibacillus laterosporus]TPG70490.1 hypothetical protein EEL31_19660 [Brevibacillus laterosporus]TPG84934.1 hypothetical protein EEL32_14925 [Brevibacillus laterosporus]
MLGLLLTTKECQEVEYLLKRELEEMLLDFGDKRIDQLVKRAMEERYATLFRMYARFASPRELSKYVRRRSMKEESL